MSTEDNATISSPEVRYPNENTEMTEVTEENPEEQWEDHKID